MKKLIFLIIMAFLVVLVIKNMRLDKFSITHVGHRKNLEETISKTLEGSSGTYAVAIKNLRTGEEYYQEEDRIFDAGSFYKLGTMLAVLQAIEKGEISEDEVVAGDVEEINQMLGVSGEEADIKEGTVDFTIKSALNQMMSISHNYAAVLLTQRVGTKKIQEAMNSLGLKDTVIDAADRPKTTASDLVTFFEKIYKREVVSTYISHVALELLLRQELNDRIPKYLPKEAHVAHKTAELGFQKHDGGIVFTAKGDYIIVVLSESNNPAAAVDRIANISKEVYVYFERKD